LCNANDTDYSLLLTCSCANCPACNTDPFCNNSSGRNCYVGTQACLTCMKADCGSELSTCNNPGGSSSSSSSSSGGPGSLPAKCVAACMQGTVANSSYHDLLACTEETCVSQLNVCTTPDFGGGACSATPTCLACMTANCGALLAACQ
jgi:hypothetical protein